MLDGLGESEVRIQVAQGVYGNAGDRKQMAEAWLQERDRERTRASNSEAATAASRAATAAERAATAAERAASATEEQARIAKKALTTARIATGIATIALIVSILGVLHFM
jgi:hypothetical protein